MSSAARMSLLMIFVMMVSLSSCTDAWDTWNINIQHNHGHALNNGFTIPSLPSGWSRNYYPYQLASTAFSTRKYQYLNYYNYTGGTCKLYCAPRSFLIKDSNGLLICQRDITTNYWGGIQDNNGDSYNQYCIPNLQSTSFCGAASQQLTNLTANCNQNSLPSYGSYNTCCFLNSLKTPTNGYDLYDEVDFLATTTYTDLVTSQN